MPTADMEKMKTSELRKMVKEHRKTSTTPAGKMSKVALLLELDKYAGTPSSQPSAAPAVKAQDKAVAVVKKVGNLTTGGSGGKSAAPKETAKVGTPVQGVKGSQAPKSVIGEPQTESNAKPIARARLIKGSQEARDFMAAIREKKTKSKDVS
jgi:hypothetical protein